MAAPNDARLRGCQGFPHRRDAADIRDAFQYGRRFAALMALAEALDDACRVGCTDEMIALTLEEAWDAREFVAREPTLEPEVAEQIAAGLSPRPERGDDR